MYEWHSLDHVPLSDSYASAAHASRTTPFDYFHINSIDVESDGELLVDARNTWAAYDVDPHTGQVRWQLGGKRSSFELGRGARTAWQHDARQQPDGAITFFDNGATPAVHRSRARSRYASTHRARRRRSCANSVHPERRWWPAARATCRRCPAATGWWAGGRPPTSPNSAPPEQLLFDAHLPAPL